MQHSRVAALESILNLIYYLRAPYNRTGTIDDDDGNSLSVERWYALWNVLSLWHHVHDVSAALKCQDDTSAKRRDMVLPVILSGVECIELVLEQTSVSSFSSIRGYNKRHRQRQRRVLIIEGVKAGVRLAMLCRYIYKETSKDGTNCWNFNSIMLKDGGTFDPYSFLCGQNHQRRQRHVSFPTPHARPKRMEYYTGKRTEKPIKFFENDVQSVASKTNFIVGELLHIVRPVYGAMLEMKHLKQNAPQIKRLYSWILCVAVDIASHRLSRQVLKEGGFSTIGIKEELRRRKLRWMLYLLRAPIWATITEPSVDVLSRTLGIVVPFLGPWAAEYVTSILMYIQRHHFLLEAAL